MRGGHDGIDGAHAYRDHMPRLHADARVLPAPNGDGHEAAPLVFLPALGFTGHSIGDAIAVRLAARYAARFSALVLVDAAVAPFRFAWWEHLAAHPLLWSPLLRMFGA